MFLTFTAFYGQIWRGQFKNDDFIVFAKNEWVQALMFVEDKHFTDAINTCRVAKELPPTLPQFVELCKQAKNRDWVNTPREEKPIDYTVAKQHLAQIKEMLNMKIN